MKREFITEHFNNINELLTTLNTRSNNEVMKDDFSSQDEDTSRWCGTSTYKESTSLLKKGYTDVLPSIRKEMDKKVKVYNQYTMLPRALPCNSVAGYIPNIPNAMRNLPNSMIYVDRIPQKRKTLSLIYLIGGSFIEDVNFFTNTGVTICTALNIAELKGIQTKLSVGFYSGSGNYQTVVATLAIKDFGHKFDLQKICFPLTHVSMFRRIGFKYLETCPKLTDSDFSGGYGIPVKNINYLKESLNINEKDTFLVDCHWIRENYYDVKKLLEYLKVK